MIDVEMFEKWLDDEIEKQKIVLRDSMKSDLPHVRMYEAGILRGLEFAKSVIRFLKDLQEAR